MYKRQVDDQEVDKVHYKVTKGSTIITFGDMYLNILAVAYTHLDVYKRQSQKMKTELISNVSHDLKTPLTSIISYIDLLKNEDLSKEQQDEMCIRDRVGQAHRIKKTVLLVG